MLLLTQPALWAEDLSPESESLLWFGGVGDFMTESGCETQLAEALRAGLEAYNLALAEEAAEHGVACFDLAAEFLGAEDAFYDEMFVFNVAGSHRVAGSIAGVLLQSEPLRSGS